MWRIAAQGAAAVPCVYVIALVLEKLLSVLLPIMQAAPESEGSMIIAGTTTARNYFFLLGLAGILVWMLAKANEESKLGGR